MRKILSVLAMIMLLFTTVVLYGCTNENKKTLTTTNVNKGKGESKTTLKLTIEEIKKKYADIKIKNIKNIGDEWVLVESQQDTFANRFDIYNLRTGDMDSLPTLGEFVTLNKIENENYFIFLSSGKNSESPFSKFPYLIKCIRVKNDLKSNDDFIALTEEKYFSLDYSMESGSKSEGILSNLNVTLEGIQVLFRPIKGKEMEFYAADTDIPLTKNIYDKEKKEIIFQIHTAQIDEKLVTKKAVSIEDNQYMNYYKIEQKDNKIYVTIGLKDGTKEYMVKIKRMPDGLPYFSIEFNNTR